MVRVPRDPEGEPPFPIVATGHWRTRRLRSFERAGTYGTLIAGIARWRAAFRVVSPFSASVPAEMKMVCNIGPAGISTGELEGVEVEGPDETFVQFDPPLGLTVFTRGFEGGV
jgi:hypothetical protein